MADNTSIKCVTFGDMISIVANRGQIAGDVQDRDLTFIKGSLNEHNIRISTERDWYWRKFDRDYVFSPAITTGTVSVTNGSRAVVFTGLTLNLSYAGRSFKVTGTNTLYRIIGINTDTNTAYLSTNYIDQTNATATFKIYSYEMPLPPDCDEVVQIYFDYPVNGYASGPRQVEAINVLQFNRALSNSIDYRAFPMAYTRDGKIAAESLPPLDIMLLDYDFLGGDPYDQVDKFRIFPIEPDITRVLHMNYSVHVENMADNSDEPLMPRDDRWTLIHFALADWFRARGQVSSADRELGIANKMLDEMRTEYKKTDPKPLMRNSMSRYRRDRYYDDTTDLFWLSRLAEY